MKVIYEAFDGEKFSTEVACLRHEQESPLFRTYDQFGKPVEVGQGVFLLHIINDSKGGEAFQRLCEKRNKYSYCISRYSSAGWYWLSGGRFSRVDEALVRAMMRACHKIEITD